MEESLDVRIVQSVAPATPSTTYNNKVPKKGEIIFNNELNNFKVGNGSTSYGNLNNFLGETTYKLTLNGTTNGDSDNGEDLGTLYAPTSFGATNKLLLAQGENAAPVWSSFNLSTGVLRFDDGWGLTSLQSLDSTNADRPILTRCTYLADNTGDRDHSYFSGKALLNHSNGGLTLENDDYIVHLTPSNSDLLTLHAISESSVTSITNKIITTSGLINNPTTSDTFLKWNGSTFDWAALPNTNTTYEFTLNGVTYDDGIDLSNGGIYAPTSQGTAQQYLRSTGNGAPVWYNLGLGISKDAFTSVNKIKLVEYNGPSTNVLSSVTPSLFFKTSLSESGIGTAKDMRLYAGDNITLEGVEESIQGVTHSGVKISADIPIASAVNPDKSGKLVVSANANPTIMYKNTGSVVGVPVFYSPNGEPATYIDTNPYTHQDQDVHSIQSTTQPFSGHYINIYDIITILAHDQIALRLFKSVLGIR